MNIVNYIATKFAIRYYTKLLHKIKDDESMSNYIYKPILLLKDYAYDDHIYHFPGNIDINIQYSIPIIRELAEKEHQCCIPFEQLKELLSYDLEQTKEELNSIRNMIVSKQEHNSPYLIIMNHIPTQRWLLLDGRYRFIEYEKFNPHEEKVPVLAVDSKMLMPAIINKSGLIAYCVH